MLLHSPYSIKIVSISILSLLLALEITTDFGAVFNAEVNKPAETVKANLSQFDQLNHSVAYSEYANVVENNIFIVDKIIQVSEVKKPVSQSRPFSMQLEITGIVITPERKLVMVWDKQSKRSHVLQHNETLDQWTVDFIDKNRVSLTSDEYGSYDFILNQDETSGLQE